MRPTSTGLKFNYAKNGALFAQYQTSSADKAAAIGKELRSAGYTVKSIPLLHSGKTLLVTTVGTKVKAADVDSVRSNFKSAWREMRAEMKAAAATPMCGTAALDDFLESAGASVLADIEAATDTEAGLAAVKAAATATDTPDLMAALKDSVKKAKESSTTFSTNKAHDAEPTMPAKIPGYNF